MDNGTATLVELAPLLLSAPTVAFRAAFLRVEGGWLLYTFVLDVFPRTAGPAWSTYHYGDVAFHARVIPGEEVVRWLAAEGGEFTLRVDGGRDHAITTRPFHPSVSWQRLPGRTSYGPDVVLWPHTRYELTAVDQARPTAPTGFLVADDAPFFPTFDEAVTELLYGSTDREHRWSSYGQQQVAVLRIAHPEAWIDRVELSPSSIAVALRGTQVEGTRLTVRGGPNLRVVKRPRRPGLVRCPLLEGLPTQPWVMLSRGTRWLDYRYLGQQFAPLAPRVDGVVVAPADLGTRIAETIARGEGPTVEFKEQTTDRLLKTVAAFANQDGGVILLGVRDGDGVVVGVPGDLNREKDRITQKIRDNLVPEPTIRIESGEQDGKQVIAVYVERGTSPPYGVDPAKTLYYVRRGATTFSARQEEVRRLGQVGTPPDAPAFS